MATHKSAVKRHKQSLKRKERNRTTKAAIRTVLKKTQSLLDAGSIEEARTQAKTATRLLDKAAVHGIMHKKTAQRSISRLHLRVNAKAAA